MWLGQPRLGILDVGLMDFCDWPRGMALRNKWCEMERNTMTKSWTKKEPFIPFDEAMPSSSQCVCVCVCVYGPRVHLCNQSNAFIEEALDILDRARPGGPPNVSAIFLSRERLEICGAQKGLFVVAMAMASSAGPFGCSLRIPSSSSSSSLPPPPSISSSSVASCSAISAKRTSHGHLFLCTSFLSRSTHSGFFNGGGKLKEIWAILFRFDYARNSVPDNENKR